MNKKITVVSYNILARLLCTEKNFLPENYDPSFILYQNRYTRLWDNLEKYVADRSIICLQEVDVLTSGKLQIDFKKRNYDFHYHSYGQTFNGYMGIAIAVPSILNVVKIDKFRIMDGKEWPRINNDSMFGTKMLKWLSWGYLDFTSNSYSNWFKSRSKYNFMLTLEIETEPCETIFVSTLHLPCAFKDQDISIMATSATLAINHIQELANDKPYVLAGDFNIRPDTVMYNFIKHGYSYLLDSCIIDDYPVEDMWRPSSVKLSGMRSALKEYNGKEPEWTNYCLNSIFGNPEPFKDTLDYIFISDHFKVVDAFSKAGNELCPNNKESSDHVLIWSVLEY